MLRIRQALIATTPEEAYQLLTTTEGRGMYIAGGTTIVPTAAKGLDFLVDINRLGLDTIDSTDGQTTIGATTKIQSILESGTLAEAPERILADASRRSATPQVRNLATIGGSIIVSGYPTDLAPALLALGASFSILGKEEKAVPAFEFFSGASDVYELGDLITRVVIPAPERGLATGVSFQKLGRTAVDVAIVSVAAVAQFEDGGRVVQSRITCGGLGGSPMRLIDVEETIAGETPDPDLLAHCSEIASKAVSPKSDLMASSEYRSEVLSVFVRRALEDCARDAGVQS